MALMRKSDRMYKLFCIILYCVPELQTQKPPGRVPWFRWAQQRMFTHIINMTAELLKDTTYKLRHAEKIKEKHSQSITYELGAIAAGIQERFYRMLQIYKKHANLKDFVAATYTVPELMNAYHVIQGDYNEIRLEKGIFHDIIRKREGTSTTSRFFSISPEFKHRGPTYRSNVLSLPKRRGGKRGMTWRPKKDLANSFPLKK